MRRYESYREPNIPWVTKIPNHWEVSKLKYLTNFINGAAFPPGSWSHKGIPIIRIENLNGGQNFNYSEEKLDERYIVGEGDLLFAWSGNIGTSFGPYIWAKDGTYYLNQHIFKLNLFDLDRQYFYWLLYAVTSYIESQTHGIIGLVHITKKDLGSIQVPIAPSSEQSKIGNYLVEKNKQIDTFIQNKRRLIELLEEQKTAIINKAVTQGLDSRVLMKDSGIDWLGEIPANWTSKRIKFMTEILRGKFSHRPRNDPAFYDGEYPFVQTGDVARAGKFLTGYSQTLNEKGLSVSKMFPKGTLVMTIAANVGDIAILDFEACFPDSIVGFKPKFDVNLFFLYYLFTAMKQELLRTAPINTQLNLNVDRIGTLFAPLPPLPVQKQIVKHLDIELKNFLEAQEIAQQEIDLINEYRTTLIGEVVTGKIDVRDAELLGEDAAFTAAD